MARRAAFAVLRAPSFAPSLPLPRRRPSGRALVVALAIAALSLLAYAVARETSLFALRAVELRGATPEVRQDIARLLGGVEGTSLVALDRAELERRLERVPSVRVASVDRAFPHTLDVRVVPERPLAVYRDGARAWLVAESGRVIRTLAPDARAELPRMRVERTSSPSPGATLSDPPTRAALDVLQAIPKAFPGSVLYALVEEGQVELALRDGPPIRLGHPLDLERKITAARAVLASLDETERAEIGYLDASVPERVVIASNTQP